MRAYKKKAQGSILIGGFFIIIVLLVVFLLSQFHAVLYSLNYKLQEERLQYVDLLSVKNQLFTCHSYPLKMEGLEICPALESHSYKISIEESEYCPAQEFKLGTGITTNTEKILLVPIYDKEKQVTCMGKLTVYYPDKVPN
ncbi:hypothetical protein H6501_03215 [Candidatus Woesearchaeota archaeon]|nr:hypothetical protein [Candidatus Woesearchaeota archaeon]USN43662.1 MAG: hypothetical protein H6500_04700 [Candidatus Woesearchaeota archaeon]